MYSVVVVWLVESDVVFSVNNEVGSVNVIALNNHFKDLRLMNSTFFHEVNSLVLHHNSVIHIVIELNLHLVLKLTSFVQEFLIFNGISKVFVILS